MNKLTFNKGTYDEGEIICTPDHKFLLRDTLMYIPNEDIIEDMSIVPCKRRVKEDGNISFCNGFKKYGHNITSRETIGTFDCYTLQVEYNNNYIVIINEKDEMQRGIVVKNCGDVMKLQIKVDDDGKIIDTKFKTFGCASAISSSSFSSEIIKNKTMDDALQITNKEISGALNLPPVKMHCSMLAEDAIKAAVADVKQKKKCTHVSSKSSNDSKHTKPVLPDTPAGC
jgi:NifU-like protein involved in Fe-S cluster formation